MRSHRVIKKIAAQSGNYERLSIGGKEPRPIKRAEARNPCVIECMIVIDRVLW
jgi:hypothetical protein